MDASAQAHLSRLFHDAATLGVDPLIEGLDAPFTTVPLTDGQSVDGALLIVSDVEDLRARIERAGSCLAPGARLALLRPTSAAGVRGAMRRLFGPKERVALEDACEALLLLRLEAVRAQCVGRDGWLAWGCVRTAP